MLLAGKLEKQVGNCLIKASYPPHPITQVKGRREEGKGKERESGRQGGKASITTTHIHQYRGALLLLLLLISRILVLEWRTWTSLL